jgi:tRNA (Thr-GGU) A37 N-methylase
MELKQIGIIHSPYQTKEEAPKQGKFNHKISEIELFDEYKAGLKTLKNSPI